MLRVADHACSSLALQMVSSCCSARSTRALSSTLCTMIPALVTLLAHTVCSWTLQWRACARGWACARCGAAWTLRMCQGLRLVGGGVRWKVQMVQMVSICEEVPGGHGRAKLPADSSTWGRVVVSTHATGGVCCGCAGGRRVQAAGPDRRGRPGDAGRPQRVHACVGHRS